jgi:hypothetical protein
MNRGALGGERPRGHHRIALASLLPVAHHNALSS